ncbi:MAG: ThuA domain-containing protein [Bacteroidota bacterium]
MKFLIILFTTASLIAQAQNLTTEEDHKRTMTLLGIKSIRQGANGRDATAPNAANYDESKVMPIEKLPDPLVLKNGKKVTTEEQWWSKRRPEVVEAFDKEILGRVPKDVPKINWEVVSTVDTSGVIAKKLIGHADNSSFPSINVDLDLTLFTPSGSKQPVPLIMEFVWRRPGITSEAKDLLLKKGWGYAEVVPVSIQADNGAGLTQGIIGLTNKGQPRKPDDWGALRAWAWGASRALDYFETDNSVDAKRVGIEGHSRYGKAAVVAMAYDPRFAIAFVSSSGEGGLSLYRRNFGELLENVAGSGEYHWMAGNFIKYAGPLTASDLPIDAHDLVALCAPRPVFISVGDKGDEWCDAKGMFLAGVYAGPVYKLLGKKDLGTTEFPAIETGLMSGEIAFRQHTAGHTPGPNWPIFISYSERYFGETFDWKAVHVLVYTKNGKGYVHDNIPFAVTALQKLASEHGFIADVTDDPSKFTDENLRNYNMLVFPSTNQDIFDTDEQRVAFRRFIEAGGGFVGLHSVVGTERKWDWFKKMLGGSFDWHPNFQKYTVRVIDKSHPSMEGIPGKWERNDECYFVKEMYPGIRAVMAQDLTTLNPKDSTRVKLSKGPYDQLYPAAWYQYYDGGTIWISALGHDKMDYSDQMFMTHVFSGMKWVAGSLKKLNYSKAYATTRDESLK